MKSGRSQLVAIILTAVIAFTCGVGGGLASGYVKNRVLSPETAAYIDKVSGNAEGQSVESQGSGGSLGQAPATVNTGSSNTGSSQNSNVTIQVSEDTTVAEAIADKVMPSVVGIDTKFMYTMSGMGGFFWGYGGQQQYEAEGVGTGFIVSSDGYILTNSHVVNDGDYNSITVSLYDGSELDGKVVWNDSTLDLAIVKVEAEDLVPAELGDSDELKIGSYAAAIGNPLGLAFERSMSQGIISGLNRSITVSNESTGGTTTMDGLIQTDATINSGNSGGPLLNSAGQVIGINSAKAASGEGMGFAIPVNVAKPIVEQVIKTGSFSRVYIGITGYGLEDQTSYSAEQLEEYFGTSTGIYVGSISENGGAEAAGLQKGDIILSVDGTKVGTMNSLNKILLPHKAGDSVTLEVLRDGKTLSFEVVLTDGSIFNTKG